MPFGYDLAWIIYIIFIAVLVLTLAVVVIRLMLAATRALDAYADDRKLRTALLVDEFDAADEAAAR